MRAFLFLFLLSPAVHAATIFVPTKNYGLEYGEPPGGYRDFKKGGFRIRAWLEAQRAPKLSDATIAIRKETVRYHDLDGPEAVKYAVLGAPRASNGHSPYFFAWIEWVVDSEFPLDLGDRRPVRKAGLAKIAIEGRGEHHLNIREWYWEKDLKDKPLDKVVPWDAAVVARKMLDFHAFRPRVKPERPDGEGIDAPY